MNLEHKLNKAAELLHELLPFISAWDLNAIKGEKIDHPWLEELKKMTAEQEYLFDGAREYQVLTSPSWLKTIEQIKEICSFEELKTKTIDLKLIGKKKKQHELTNLYQLLESKRAQNIVDFGGGVGNLAYFLEQNLNMKVHVLEQNPELISTGIKRTKKLGSSITFSKQKIDHSPLFIAELENAPMSIGLHTCGNFANNMLRKSQDHKVKEIINFGCCYSKITDDDYNISSFSDKSLHFNQRALSIATLGYSPVPKEMYHYRIKIMNYKFSFYNWLYQEFGELKFLAMSNARRTLYELSFSEFVSFNMKKFHPEKKIPPSEVLQDFYTSSSNIELTNYFKNYYAIARYFGKLLEVYLLCDRALYLQENSYHVKIINVFDPKISPRNKAIIATRI